jgi:hypothetical protein
MHTGRTVIGFRIFDLLQTVRALPALGLGEEAVVVARGGAGIQALHAAVLDNGISAVCAWRSLTDYMDVVRTPLYRVRFYDMVPKVTDAYDLPHLAASLAPRPLALVGAVDAKLEPAELTSVEATYHLAQDTYTNLGVKANLTIEAADVEVREVQKIVEWVAAVRKTRK